MYPAQLEKLLRENLLLDEVKANISVFLKIFRKSIFEENNGKRVLIITDKGKTQRRIAPMMAYGYFLAAQELDMRPRLIDVHNDTQDPFELIDSIPKKSIVVLALSQKLKSAGKFKKHVRGLVNKKDHKLISSTGLCGVKSLLFKHIVSMCNVDFHKMHEIGEKIKSLLDTSSKVTITTKNGTNINFSIKNRHAISNDGYYKNTNGGNMPAGEVYIAPVEDQTNGVIVIDGSLRTIDDTFLIKNPIKLTIKSGIITKIEGGIGAQLLEKCLTEARLKDKNKDSSRIIGELGIGINSKAKVIGPTLINEKTLGTFHVAIGSNYYFGGENRSSIHLDQVVKDPTIYIDDRKLEIYKK